MSTLYVIDHQPAGVLVWQRDRATCPDLDGDVTLASDHRGIVSAFTSDRRRALALADVEALRAAWDRINPATRSSCRVLVWGTWDVADPSLVSRDNAVRCSEACGVTTRNLSGTCDLCELTTTTEANHG